MSLVIFLRIGGLIAMASMMCTGIAERTWRTSASRSPRERRDAFQEASFWPSLSTSGRRAVGEAFRMERGRPRYLMGEASNGAGE